MAQGERVACPWSLHCKRRNRPVAVGHCFIYFTGTVFYGTVLIQCILRKHLDITPCTTWFLFFRYWDHIPHDTFVLIGLRSLWGCRLLDRHAELCEGPPSRIICRSEKCVYAPRPLLSLVSCVWVAPSTSRVLVYPFLWSSVWLCSLYCNLSSLKPGSHFARSLYILVIVSCEWCSNCHRLRTSFKTLLLHNKGKENTA